MLPVCFVRMLPVCTTYRAPPSPLVFWNHGVRGGVGSKSLRNKDLHVKYSGIKTYLALFLKWSFQDVTDLKLFGCQRANDTLGNYILVARSASMRDWDEMPALGSFSDR